MNQDASEAAWSGDNPGNGHKVTFSTSGGYMAYRKNEVDALVDRVQAARRDPAARSGITAADLRNPALVEAAFGEVGYSKSEVNAYLELVGTELGLALGARAALRHRWRVRRGMIQVLDPNGARWTVYRRWFPNWNLSFLHGADPGDLGMYLLAVFWPPWLVAKWLGVRWVILVERNGREMADERVRGWRKSQRRLHEIAESVGAGNAYPRRGDHHSGN